MPGGYVASAEGTTASMCRYEHARVIHLLASPVLEQRRMGRAQPTDAAGCMVLLDRANSGRGQHVGIALYGCMISIQNYAVQPYLLSGGINPLFRCSDFGPSAHRLAPVLDQHNRDAAAGLGYPETEFDALACDGVLHAKETAR